MERIKGDVFHPFVERARLGSQLHQSLAPELSLNQLAQGMCARGDIAWRMDVLFPY
jgi:hypothetical protein